MLQKDTHQQQHVHDEGNDREDDNGDCGAEEEKQEDAANDEGRDDQKEVRDNEEEDQGKYKVVVDEDHSMRRQISFGIASVRTGHTIQILSYGFNVERAVRMAEIIKMRVGMLHQETSLLMGKTADSSNGDNANRMRGESSGILIKLSKKPLDQNAVGYQKPKPKDEALCKYFLCQSCRQLQGQERTIQRFSSKQRYIAREKNEC